MTSANNSNLWQTGNRRSPKTCQGHQQHRWRSRTYRLGPSSGAVLSGPASTGTSHPLEDMATCCHFGALDWLPAPARMDVTPCLPSSSLLSQVPPLGASQLQGARLLYTNHGQRLWNSYFWRGHLSAHESLPLPHVHLLPLSTTNFLYKVIHSDTIL